jgi:peptidyl-prolyl cis-trans isomerase C
MAKGSAPSATPAALADSHRRAVVAHVGPRAVTVGELEDRLSPIPRYQLRLYGSTAPEVARSFFDRVLLRDVLLGLGAEDKHIDQDLGVQQALERMLSSATLRTILIQVGSIAAIPMEDVQRYYDANRARFDSKDRIQIWRILCGTREEALTVLDQAKKDGAVPSFMKLSREHNLDKATALRGGNLGFVDEGGKSNEPGLVVDPAILKAAAGVKDGELVPAPVQEGTSYAVVWRRGTQAGVHRTVDQVKLQIQDTIAREKREAAEKALLDKLRAEKVTIVDDSALGDFDIAIDDGTIGPKRRTRGASIP